MRTHLHSLSHPVCPHTPTAATPPAHVHPHPVTITEGKDTLSSCSHTHRHPRACTPTCTQPGLKAIALPMHTPLPALPEGATPPERCPSYTCTTYTHTHKPAVEKYTLQPTHTPNPSLGADTPPHHHPPSLPANTAPPQHSRVPEHLSRLNPHHTQPPWVQIQHSSADTLPFPVCRYTPSATHTDTRSPHP